MVRHPVEYLLASAVYWLVALVLGVLPVVVASQNVAAFVAASITDGNIRLVNA